MSVKNNIFLEVKDLTVEYTSGNDVVHAVNGISFWYSATTNIPRESPCC